MSEKTCTSCAHFLQSPAGPDCSKCWPEQAWHSKPAWTPIATVKEPKPGPAPAPSGGMKFDQDKPRMDLLDPLWLEETAKVLSFGAKKYAAHNWRQGISTSRLSGAALRHLWAYVRGEDKDPESGLPHLAHASCCLMFLTNMAATRPDMDDRFKG